jgi:hypothetical protein
MLQLYSTIHWTIMLDKTGFPSQKSHEAVVILGELGWLRIGFSVLAMAWAVCAIRRQPRWAVLIAIGLAVFAVMTDLVIM